MWTKRDASSSVKEVVLRNTGLTEEELLSPAKSPHLFHLKEAVALIRKGVEDKKRIYIAGDYDADGVTATSIMYLMLKQLDPNLRVVARLPRRFSEGYGLNPKMIDEFEPNSLLITVDNGIAAAEAVKKAKEKNITVVVVDHHLAPEDGILPDADCIIDPNTDYDTESVFRGYCGAGLAYRIVEELLPNSNLDYFKALAAVGTVADVMPLLHDNRNIVLEGLKVMSPPLNRKHWNCGLISIINRLDLMDVQVTAEDIGFKIGPIINAAGRMKDDGATLAFNALISDDEFEANNLAKDLIDLNDSRKDLVKESVLEAEGIIADECLFGDHPMIVAGDFHEGIVGILAGRLSEEYKTPVIVLANVDGHTWKGSGRSYGDVHLKELLDTASDLLIAYGGHAGAVGLSVSDDNLADLRERLIKNLPPETKVSSEENFYDLEITSSQIPEIYDELQKYAPYGEANPKVVFKITDYRLAPKYGKFFSKLGDGSIVKFNGHECDAIGFGLAEKYDFADNPRLMNLYGVIGSNSYGGIVSKQIEVFDFEKLSDPAKPSSLMSLLSQRMAGFNTR